MVMPRKKNPDHVSKPSGRPMIYPWNVWLDGNTHILESGGHFDCTVESIRTQVYQQAAARKIKASVKTVRPGVISVTAMPTGSAGGARAKYDWDQLLDGEVHQLRLGREVSSKPNSFRVYARQVAAERGLKVTIKTLGDSLFLRALRPKPALSDLPFEIETP